MRLFYFNWDNCGFTFSCSKVFRSTDLLTQTLPLVTFWEQEFCIIQDLDSLPFCGKPTKVYCIPVHMLPVVKTLNPTSYPSSRITQVLYYSEDAHLVNVPRSIQWPLSPSPHFQCISYPWQSLYYSPSQNSWMFFMLPNNGAQALIFAKQTFYHQAISQHPISHILSFHEVILVLSHSTPPQLDSLLSRNASRSSKSQSQSIISLCSKKHFKSIGTIVWPALGTFLASILCLESIPLMTYKVKVLFFCGYAINPSEI